MSKLFIIESPNKIHKLKDILGKGYKIMATVGHIMDLNPKELSVDVKNNFVPTYIINKDKQKIVDEIKSEAKKATEVILASDLDREGEMIAYNVATLLKLKKPIRVTFDEVTKKKVLDAIKHPRTLDNNLIMAQQMRRILDRLVGYMLSPIVDQSVKGGTSAGRVQSVIVRLIVDKETEINTFISSGKASQYKFDASFTDNKDTLVKAALYHIDNKETKDDEDTETGRTLINDKKTAQSLMESHSKSTFKITAIVERDSTRNPPAPYTTSSLQQDAATKLHFSLKRTMMTAQHLFEAGYTTYPRTDSPAISSEIMDDIEEYINDNYDKSLYKRTTYKAKSMNAQEAHECIRPTDISNATINKANKIDDDEVKLYRLIWQRTVASQMVAAKHRSRTIQISISKDKDNIYKISESKIVSPGYLTVYDMKESDYIYTFSLNTKIPCKSIESIEEFKKPPTRYNEGSIVKQLEKLSICRPATTASFITKIQDKKYVEEKDIDGSQRDISIIKWDADTNTINTTLSKIKYGSEKKKLCPTKVGMNVTDFLVKNFGDIMDYKFTATMEQQLDEVANGKIEWLPVMNEFYDKFSKTVTALKKRQIIGK